MSDANDIPPISMKWSKTFNGNIPVCEWCEMSGGHSDECYEKQVDSLRSQRDALAEALDKVREAIEMQAADKSYNCGLGVGEWEAFIDTVPLYKEWKMIKQALAAAPEVGKNG